MIIPMKRVCLIVQEKEQKEALLKLRGLGLMHVESTNATSDGLSGAHWRKTEINDAFGLAETYLPQNTKKSGPEDEKSETEATHNNVTHHEHLMEGAKEHEYIEAEETEEVNEPGKYYPDEEPGRLFIADRILRMDNYRQILEVNRLILVKERDRIANWGSFHPEEIAELSAFFGCPLKLYQAPPYAVEGIPEETRYIKICDDSFSSYIMTLGGDIPGLQPFSLPDRSLSQIENEITEIGEKLAEIDRQVKILASHTDMLEKEKEAVESRIDFEAALAEFVNIDEDLHEHNASYLRGYTLAEDAGKLKEAAGKHGWGFIAYDPLPENNAPVKLRHSAAGKIISPVMGFLDILPGYHEPDISGWFLLFFTVFFGIIFGDAVYGSLLLAIALAGIFRTRKKGIPDMLMLLLLLAISNTVWGVMTCSWLGIPAADLPQILKDISLTAISPAKNDKASIDQNLKIMFFTLALIHLSIAHVCNMIRHIRARNLKFLAEIGCFAIICGVYNLILFLVVSNSSRSIPFLPVSIYLIAGGVLLNLFFSYYEGHFGKSVLNGLSNIMSVILNVSNTFSDIMSYIRLWALGLAGSSIASMVSKMASPMLTGFLVFAGILIITFGHGLNMVLNTLSVMIHGVRLNILEFSLHAGVSWSGIAYKPFAETVKK